MAFNYRACVAMNLTRCFATYNQLIYPRFTAKLISFQIREKAVAVAAAAVIKYINPLTLASTLRQYVALEQSSYGHIKTLKLHSTGPIYSNTVIGTMSVDGWAVTFGTARRGLGGLWFRPDLSSLYQM